MAKKIKNENTEKDFSESKTPVINSDLDFYSLEQASERLRVNERFLRNAISSGDLKAKRVGGKLIFIMHDDLTKFIQSGEDAKETARQIRKDTEG